MDGPIDGHGESGSPHGAAWVDWRASTSGAVGIHGTVLLPKQSPQRARLSTAMDPLHPKSVDALIGPIIRAGSAVGVHTSRAAAVAVNVDR